jgi:hypothetical protein
MAFGQQQPLVPRGLDHDRRTSPAFAASWSAPNSRSSSTTPGPEGTRRRRFPRLYAMRPNHSHTSMDRNRWQLSRVIFTAGLPSLIHCCAVPRRNLATASCRAGRRYNAWPPRYRPTHSQGVTSFSALVARAKDTLVVRIPVNQEARAFSLTRSVNGNIIEKS